MLLKKSLPLIGLGILLLVTITLAPSPATAALLEQQATPTLNPKLSIGNDTCLECHGKPGLTMKLEDGEELGLYVDPEEYASSIHGKSGYACVQCHTSVGDYPHPPFTAADRRDASLKLYPACYRCHSGEYERSQDSVHTKAMANGKREAAVCTDCHTAHAVRLLNDAKTGQLLPDAHAWIPQTCAQCHNAIYQKYLTSVHGSALMGEGNPDVPTCIDCHGVHNIASPLVNAFRLKSPELCAKCHTDPKRMAKYGISTQVLTTYVADFHGTTINIFEKESPDAPTNKPVCFDCHGVHDITRTDDPQKGLIVKENLLARCKTCHPDATANFPSAWLSHYIPSAKQNSLVFYVGWFYKLLIPIVLGGMALLIVMDFSRTILNSSRKRRPALISPEREERKLPPEKTELPAESLVSPPAPETEPSTAVERPSSPTPEALPSPDIKTQLPTSEGVQPAPADETLSSSVEEPEPLDEETTYADTVVSAETPVKNQAEVESADETTTTPQQPDEEVTNE
jgi:predicted CXXCH cytochrome family protein